MPELLVRRKWAMVFTAVVLAGVFSVSFLVFRGHDPDFQSAGNRVMSPAPGHLWGGARNSAAEDGTGSFDRQASARFTSAVKPELRQYVVELNARAFLPLPGTEHLAAVFGTAGISGTDSQFPNSRKLVSVPEIRRLVSVPARVAYLQFKDNPREEERRQLAAGGLELLNYVSGHAWCARGTPEAFHAALSLGFVRAVAAMDARDKLHSLVFRGATPDYALETDGRARFWLLAQPGTTPDALAWQMAGDDALAGLQAKPALRSVLGPRFEIVASVEAALRLAALDAAAFLSFVPPPFANRNPPAAVPTGGTPVVRPRDATTDVESNISAVRDNAPNVSGNGIKVAAREIGRMDAHQDFAARLTYVQGDGQTDADSVDHATAVTGQMGSDGHTQPSAKGVAPGVSILAYSVGFDPDTFATTDIIDAASRGARASNHSYGPAGLTVWGDYETISADWDGAAHDNDLLVVSAGNEESGHLSQHMDFFAGAKNTTCVSATDKTARAGDPTANPPLPQQDGIASFTEFGPMNDGRVKPDLVAFGDNVTLDQGSNSTQKNSGTSFSTPVVTGAAGLIFEHYKAKVGREPSGALAKAILCNSATDLGQPGPDAVYGFGILNVKAAIAMIDLYQNAGLTPFVEGVTTNGNANSFTVNLNGAQQLKVTLCWLDVPGNPSAAKALVNDLDLEVVAPDGTLYFPYSLDPNAPSAAATKTGPNTVDPIEQTVVGSPTNGTWTIRVVGKNLPQEHQAFAVCLNQAAVAPNAAVITASPISGQAPLAVSFSAAQSTGSSSTYSWDFGDSSTGQGVTVSHTYTDSGTYTVTLTEDGGASATQQIYVSKPASSAQPLNARATLRFASRTMNDDLQFTIHADGLKMSPTDARNALRNGTFTNMRFAINVGGSADGTTAATNVASVALKKNATATFKDTSVRPNPTITFRLTPQKGQVQVQLHNVFLEDIFNASGMTTSLSSNGRHAMPVEVESADTIYRAVFNLNYRALSRGRMGTAKFP